MFNCVPHIIDARLYCNESMINTVPTEAVLITRCYTNVEQLTHTHTLCGEPIATEENIAFSLSSGNTKTSEQNPVEGVETTAAFVQ